MTTSIKNMPAAIDLADTWNYSADLMLNLINTKISAVTMSKDVYIITYRSPKNVSFSILNQTTPVTREQSLIFKLWLVMMFDPDLNELSSLLRTHCSHRMESINLEILDYINTLVELKQWLKSTVPPNATSVDFSSCNVPLVREAIDVMKSVDYNELKRRCDRHDDIVLHRDGQDNEIVCYTNVFGGIEYASRIDGLTMMSGESLYTKDNPDQTLSVLLTGGHTADFNNAHNVIALLDLMAGVLKLRTMLHLFEDNTNGSK